MPVVLHFPGEAGHYMVQGHPWSSRYYEGIRAIGPSRTSVFIDFVPVSGVFFGWLILDETVNLSLLVGTVLVIAGVYLTNRPDGYVMDKT